MYRFVNDANRTNPSAKIYLCDRFSLLMPATRLTGLPWKYKMISFQEDTSLRPYPVMMNLQNRRVIVVGGGRVAYRKIVSLIESGAAVVCISPVVNSELDELVSTKQITWIKSRFDESFLAEYPETALIFGTTDNREVNVRIYQAAAINKIPCNIADVPDLCTFIVPAVITQGDLMIAVSTGGASPALAKRIRTQLQEQYGPEYAEMTALMGELRKLILKAGASSDENKKIFHEIVDSDILPALKKQDRERVVRILKDILPKDIDLESAVEKPAPS
jgi:precorrin-2 dehydrogenase / sirohydrochlorin ferrochelatase